MLNDKEINDNKLAGNIKRLMDELGFNQVDLAKRANIPRSTLTHFFTGRTHKIGWPILYGIAKALDCSMEELIEGPHPRPDIDKIAQQIADEAKGSLDILIKTRLAELIPQTCPNCGTDLCPSSAQQVLDRTKKRFKKAIQKSPTSTETTDSKE